MLIRDYWILCKPRVVALMLLTAAVGMALSAPTPFPWFKAWVALFGIACVAGAAAALNHFFDQEIDQHMKRTQNRPLPKGRIKPQEALIFACILGLVGMGSLYQYVNPLTAGLTFLSLIGYAIIYTTYLKHATPQNIVIGGATGAAPPLLGWTAMTGQLDPHALLLMLIIYVWTPPHFWALAIYKEAEYAKANVPMLPITHGLSLTRLFIFLYTCLLTGTTLLPYAFEMSGLTYAFSALILDAIFLHKTIQLLRTGDRKKAWNIFHYSIYYLFLLFIALIVDHYLITH